VAIATVLKVGGMARNGRIAEQLGMEALTGVSRCTSEYLRGDPNDALLESIENHRKIKSLTPLIA